MPRRVIDALRAAITIVVFGLAGPAANAQSSLSNANAQELERLLSISEGKVAVPFSSSTPPRVPASTLDRYLMWNEIALDTTAIDHTPGPAFGEQYGPTRASYAMAIIHIAMFDAVNAISKKYVSYSGIAPVLGDVSEDRAIAEAAHNALIALYPLQKDRLDAIFNADIATISGSQASIAAGAALGALAAKAIFSKRQNDGSALPEPTVMQTCNPSDDACFPVNTAPGKWQITLSAS